MRDQISGLLLDGLLSRSSPVFLWVSANPAQLDDAVEGMAVRIVEGRAPEVLQGRRLLRADAAGLLAALSGADLPPVDQMEATLRELEESGAALALDQPELLGTVDMAFDPADALWTALASGRLGCFIGLTDPSGLGRLRAEQPRLLMLASVYELDTGSSYRPGRLVLSVSDPTEAGWLMMVRCQLLAPVDGLDELSAEGSASQLRAARELDAIGIEDFSAVITDVSIDGVMISVRADVANLDQESTAERTALAGTQQLIGRPLAEGEQLEVTRRIYLELKAAPP